MSNFTRDELNDNTQNVMFPYSKTLGLLHIFNRVFKFSY